MTRPLYRETGQGSWIFDGKILMNDFYRITGSDSELFADVRDPRPLRDCFWSSLRRSLKGRVVSAAGFKFTIETVEKRRIREILAERKVPGL
jgi:CBS domain containing-hemolysin-like protein